MTTQGGRGYKAPGHDTNTTASLAERDLVRFVTQYAAARRDYCDLIREVYPPGREPGGYLRWRDNQTMTTRREPAEAGRTCAIDGCLGRHYARGWCQSHYGRWQRHGDPLGGRWLAAAEPMTHEQILAECLEALAALTEQLKEGEGQ